MKTNSSKMLSSNYCFLFEKCAREAASLAAPGHAHNPWFCCEGPTSLKLVSESFVLKIDAKWTPKLYPKSTSI